jgi:hypothetical protein
VKSPDQVELLRICFPSSFVASETTRLAAALSSTEDIVGSVLAPVTRKWTTAAQGEAAIKADKTFIAKQKAAPKAPVAA